MVSKTEKLILSKMDALQGTLDWLFQDLDEDRKMIAEVRTSQAKVEEVSKQLLDMYSNIVRRVGQKAEEKTEQAIDAGAEAVANLVEPAVDKAVKKVNNGQPLRTNRPWWKLF